MADKITAIIVAAGNGTRMGGQINKVFLPLGNGTVISKTVDAMCSCTEISDIVVVTRSCDVLECMELLKNTQKRVRIITGGKTRQESVYKGLLEARDSNIVVIHDGARALILPETVKRTIMDAKTFGASAVGVMCKDTLKSVDTDGFIENTLDREKTYLIQTPQIFVRDDILKAHEMAMEEKFLATDDCALYERYIGRVKVTDGSYDNIKLTTPDDMEIAENILKRRGN